MLSFPALRGETWKGLERLFAVLMAVVLPWKNWRLRGSCALLGREPTCSDLLQLCEWVSHAELYPPEAIPRQREEKKKDRTALTRRSAVLFAKPDCIKYRRCKKKKKISCYFPQYFFFFFFGRMCPLSSKDCIQSSANNEISSNPSGSQQGHLIGLYLYREEHLEFCWARVH